ncbi:uncharacterized protein I303_108298 [Kwoniella dejecticola CBS 10117]|uniref:Uncharacterized protein n=1 Tax=Kwoniella dejecticola CBS 10117 TaxID=1296121 RepID=A0A1A5ZXU0_9TREE|nr:uncharacterized protein I303_07375 [Kwoniella dejecticola CBS 10117]OBR82613.1 hypothetical protein I303_07375 [Kwoniella dejecticola CBS 10117]
MSPTFKFIDIKGNNTTQLYSTLDKVITIVNTNTNTNANKSAQAHTSKDKTLNVYSPLNYGDLPTLLKKPLRRFTTSSSTSSFKFVFHTGGNTGGVETPSTSTSTSDSDSGSKVGSQDERDHGISRPAVQADAYYLTNLSDTLVLDTPDKLYQYLSQPLPNELSSIRYKHLYLKFDLRYFRDNKMWNLFWTIPAKYNNQLSFLETVHLTTLGFNFYVESRVVVQNNEHHAGSMKETIVSLDMSISRLLDLTVDPNGPGSFTWKSENNLWKRWWNAHRQNSAYTYPKMPRTIYEWRNTREFTLPYLVRPNWDIPHHASKSVSKWTRKGQGRNSDAPIEKISIPAEGIHKWVKGEAMEYLVRDMIRRSDGETPMTLELRGILPRHRVDYMDKLMSVIINGGADGMIQIVWTENEKKKKNGEKVNRE